MRSSTSHEDGPQSLAEIIERSPQKQVQDRLFNEMQDNAAKAQWSFLSAVDAAKGSGSYTDILRGRKGPRNERDELFDYFYAKLAPAWLQFTKKPLRKAYLAVKISHLKERDLFYIKSVCIDAENRGGSFSKVFWGSLKPRPEDVHSGPESR